MVRGNGGGGGGRGGRKKGENIKTTEQKRGRCIGANETEEE